jgi:hypothetical protein
VTRGARDVGVRRVCALALRAVSAGRLRDAWRGRRGGPVAYALGPVLREQPVHGDVEGSGEADVEADGDVVLAAFDALELAVADAGCVAKLLLGEVLPLADAGDDAADAPEVVQRRGIEWIFRHIATLEVRGLQDHAKPGEFLDQATPLNDASYIDTVARMFGLAIANAHR